MTNKIPNRRSRAKYDCPPKLKKLLLLTNLAPPEAELESANSIEKKVAGDFLKAQGVSTANELDERGFTEYWMRWLDACHRNFSDSYQHRHSHSDLKRLIDSARTDQDLKNLQLTMLEGVQDYDQIRLVREHVLFIAKQVEQRRDNLRPYHMGEIDLVEQSRQARIVFTVDASGEERSRVVRPLDTVIDAFDNVYIDRLRICKTCSRVFWAKNKNSETDSDVCANALKQRRFRKQNPDKLKAQRAENYRNKKDGKVK